MRAGKLDRFITIERQSIIDDGYGGSTPGPAVDVVTLRAQVIQASTEEFIRAYGASSETAIIFRTRYADGIRLSDVVSYDGDAFNIVELKEIGRGRGLEIRCHGFRGAS